MRISIPLWGGAGLIGLALFLAATPPEEPRVQLNPHAPKASRWGLAWNMKLDNPAPATASSTAARPSAAAAPVQQSSVPADAGVWATPAEWSDSD